MAGPANTKQRLQHVAIVGAGLAGLATAIFLRRLNLTVTIFEARPRDAADGGFLSLAPNAANVLDQLGLYENLLPQGFAFEDYTFLSSRNCSKIGSTLIGSVQRYGYPALRIQRHVLRQTLLEAAVKAGASIQFEHKVTKIGETATNVSITFASDQPSPSFDYLVACDGIHSRVRKLVVPLAPEPTFSGQIGVGGGQVQSTAVPSDIPQPCIVIGANHSYYMMPTTADGSSIGISATIEMEERTREGWAELAADRTQLKQMLVDRHCGSDSSWPEAVQKCVQLADAQSLTIWPFYNAPVLESWTSDASRIVLIGDAAHAMPPTGGQGAAMAFEDAASLSLVFSNLVSGHDDITADLGAWQSRRQARAKKVKAFTSKGGDVRRASSSVMQQLLKEWAMWAYFSIKGPEGGCAWIYKHREEVPAVEDEDSKGR